MLVRLIISIHWLPMQTNLRCMGQAPPICDLSSEAPPRHPTVSMPLLQLVRLSCRGTQGVQIGQGYLQPIHALHELLRHAAKAFVEACHPQHALSLIGAHQSMQRTVHAHQQQGQPSNSLTVGMQHHQSRSPLGAASIKLAHLLGVSLSKSLTFSCFDHQTRSPQKLSTIKLTHLLGV